MALHIIINYDKATSASVRLRHRHVSMQGIHTYLCWPVKKSLAYCQERVWHTGSRSSNAVEDTAHEDVCAASSGKTVQLTLLAIAHDRELSC